MKHQLIDNNGGKPVSYESLVIEPSKLSVFGSELSLKIVQELVKEPACAMDLSRRMGQHEQKIYYHLRRLEGAGVVEQIRSEKRYSMTAKIYGVVAPVVAAKLYEGGRSVGKNPNVLNPSLKKLFHPFIKDGKMNTKMILGSPYPHGEYEATARHGVHLIDFSIFIGGFLTSSKPGNYMLDTQTKKEILQNNNIILIGNPKTNTITQKINDQLPIYFDEKRGWTIRSRLTGKKYDYDHDAVIIKMPNPFNKEYSMLFMGGKRSMGLRSATIAIINNYDDILKGNSSDSKIIAKVVTGLDKTGDGIIDSVKIRE